MEGRAHIRGRQTRLSFGLPLRGSRLALCCAVATVFTSTTPAAGAQAGQAPPTAAAWWRTYFSASRSVSLPDGRKINLYCKGEGGPVVVMESGLGSAAWTWSRVQHEIAATSRVCVYDRAGYFGRSTPAPGPRTAGDEANDLAALLQAARIPGPYVLVGHSYGGHIVRLFAYRHPGSVAGLVLVDPSVEHQRRRGDHLATPASRAQADAAKARMSRCATEATRVGADCVLRPPPRDLPPDLAGWFVQAQDAAYADTMRREDEAMNAESSAQLVRERRSLGRTPVILLERDLSIMPPGEHTAEDVAVFEASGKLWREMHQEVLAGISSRASLLPAPGSGHRIQDDEPDAVVAAVKEVVAAARRK